MAEEPSLSGIATTALLRAAIAAPQLLVQIVVGFYALSTWSRHPRVSRLVVIIVVLELLLFATLRTAHLIIELRFAGADYDNDVLYQNLMTGLRAVDSAGGIVTITLLIGAMFAWRQTLPRQRPAAPQPTPRVPL